MERVKDDLEKYSEPSCIGVKRPKSALANAQMNCYISYVGNDNNEDDFSSEYQW